VTGTGPGFLDDNTPVANEEVYAYNGRNPMCGEDVSLSKSADSSFIVVWENDGSVYYNFMDPMGLCERDTICFCAEDDDYTYRNPDVACDLTSSTDESFGWFMREDLLRKILQMKYF
jgi:hypothetical protein